MGMMWTPFESAYSGIHTTFARSINAAGTLLETKTGTPYDVIQRLADVRRHEMSEDIEASDVMPIRYGLSHDKNGSETTAATTQTAAELANVHVYRDALVKKVSIDMTFYSSRAFPVRISIAMVRSIKPRAMPFTLTQSEQVDFFNDLTSRGHEYNSWKEEWRHEFTLPSLKIGKKPPQKHIKKMIHCNFLQTNAFQATTNSEAAMESGQTLLGQGIRRQQNEVADGNHSGAFFIIMKWRKVQQIQQYTYTQAVDARAATTAPADGNPQVTASIELPIVSEDSFDVPEAHGYTVSNVGTHTSPLGQQYTANEARASFYYIGKLGYQWGHKDTATEGIPSVMSLQSGSTNYKKTLSLNIDPTVTGDNTHGIYTRSQSHQTRSVVPAGQADETTGQP